MLPVAWSVWGAGLLGILYAFFVIVTERTDSPEAGRGLGAGLVLFLLLLSGMGALALRWAASRQSVLGVSILTLVLAYPFVAIAADKAIRAAKERKYAVEFAEPPSERRAN